MKVYKLKNVKSRALDDIVCDMCGKSCFDCDKMNIEKSHLSASWGYNSKKDGITWQADFCEVCSDKINDFIIKNGGHIVEQKYI